MADNLLGAATQLPTWGKASGLAREAITGFVKRMATLKDNEAIPVNITAFPNHVDGFQTILSALRKAAETVDGVKVSVRDGVVYLSKGQRQTRTRKVADTPAQPKPRTRKGSEASVAAAADTLGL